jgi:hypothetical protein
LVAIRIVGRSDPRTVYRPKATAFATGCQRLRLASFRFDRNGDISPTPVSIYRITGKTPAAVDVFGSFRGAVVDRVIHVPQGLSH